MKGDVAMTIADSLSAYASAEAMGKTLHALPTDTVLHTEADLDDFEREKLYDDCLRIPAWFHWSTYEYRIRFGAYVSIIR